MQQRLPIQAMVCTTGGASIVDKAVKDPSLTRQGDGLIPAAGLRAGKAFPLADKCPTQRLSPCQRAKWSRGRGGDGRGWSAALTAHHDLGNEAHDG